MTGKNSILIVDDAKSNLLYLNHLLSGDYLIYTARNAKEAIERANNYRPDLILLDVVMPDISGYEIFEELKKSDRSKDIPIVFITGLSGIEDELKGLNIGADDYITKPFSDAVIKLRIRNQIKIVNQMRTLDKRYEQQTLMTSIAKCFLTDEHSDAICAKTLQLIGEFSNLSQILLFKSDDNGAVLTCKSEWINPNLNLGTRIDSKLELKEPMLSFIKGMSMRGEQCMHSDDPVFKEVLAPYRVSFQSCITAPIFIKGKIYAVLDFSREDEASEWSDSEINLACLVASIFSGVFEREAIEHDLNTVLKLKSELTVEKERAERNSRIKSEFLSRMSHEMRTPMNAIMGMTSLAQSTDDPAKRQKYLEEVKSASKNLLQFINDLLDISDIEKGALSFNPSRLSFSAMLKNIFDETEPLFKKKNLSFSADIDPSVPDILTGDEKRISQVISNLLSNAAKFTGNNGLIQLKAFILNTKNDMLTIQIEVSDNGIGISEDQKKHLFEVFEQVDGGIKRKTGGAGLGLYMSKSMVEMMGGMIWFESELGKGSKFAFTFTATR